MKTIIILTAALLLSGCVISQKPSALYEANGMKMYVESGGEIEITEGNTTFKLTTPTPDNLVEDAILSKFKFLDSGILR